ncbi:prolipoprotein diacylglyceryl transferase [Candidatus Falkowbacteria bacterium]|nr:prolipoprotein diacylglyceryl transferase [Candidatus Falkowbacteria bacterium]
MIPWIEYQSINAGFLKLNVWGIFVSLGFLLGMVVAYFELKKKKLEVNRVYDLAFWIILSALIGGRLLYVAEHLNIYFAAPLLILKLWQGGMSVYGGFLGAILASVLYLKKYKLKFWQYADAVVFGLPLGLFIGRLGCFFIHDHLGAKTDFFLGVAYSGGARHDLGLYDSLGGLILFFIFLILRRKERFSGFYVAAFAVWYGAVRFFLDFLRARDLVGADPRYFGLTLAQYLSVILFAAGIYIFYRLKRRREDFQDKKAI